jgi:hypothetical protein
MLVVKTAKKLPASPGTQAVVWTQNSVVGISTSPFSGQSQAQEWPGQWWSAQVTYPRMTRAQAAAVIATLVSLHGMANTLLFGPIDCAVPRGANLGAPVMDGASNGVGAGSILTRGWTPNTANVLVRGDWVSLDNFLYLICSDESADGTGVASFDIWPNLRTNPQDGLQIVTNSPQGIFRLASNQLAFDVDEAITYGIQFNLVEAI